MRQDLKVLFYNWVPFDDDENRGGGVSVYQKNLIEALVAQGIQVDFLSSGLAYSLESTEPKIRQTENAYDPDCRSFQLVNSPVMSPGHSAFGWNDRLFEKGPALEVFHAFLHKNGPYDIVHFNNVEGIPFTFLELKDEFPQTLVVFSHHNYFPVCPQVNLWSHESKHCDDFDHGRACVDCLVWKPPKVEIFAAQQLSTLLKSSGVSATSPIFARAFSETGTLRLFADLARQRDQAFLREDHLPMKPGEENSFARRRRLAVAILNRSVDIHLAVSERVARVLVSYGVNAKNCHVSYIGTKHSQLLEKAQKRQSLADPDVLSIAYLGYMRGDKGFFFLLEALERLPASIARRLRVKFAAKSNGDPNIGRRINDLRQWLAGVEHMDGYKHTDLPRLMADVDLGVVPVLWEDNLPQVALEIMSHGVPVLCSDKGGAQELGGNPDFVFQAGSHDAFAEALRRVQTGEVPLSSFWDSAMKLRSMEDHLTELFGLYEDGLARIATGQDANAMPLGQTVSTACVLDDAELDDLNHAHALNSWMMHDA